MSAGKSAFQKTPIKLEPKERGPGGSESVPQEVSSKGRRDKLINQNSTSPRSGPVNDVHELV